MMSGSVLAPWAAQVSPRDNAKVLGRKLQCPVDSSSALLSCLQVSIDFFVLIILK